MLTSLCLTTHFFLSRFKPEIIWAKEWCSATIVCILGRRFRFRWSRVWNGRSYGNRWCRGWQRWLWLLRLSGLSRLWHIWEEGGGGEGEENCKEMVVFRSGGWLLKHWIAGVRKSTDLIEDTDHVMCEIFYKRFEMWCLWHKQFITVYVRKNWNLWCHDYVILVFFLLYPFNELIVVVDWTCSLYILKILSCKKYVVLSPKDVKPKQRRHNILIFLPNGIASGQCLICIILINLQNKKYFSEAGICWTQSNEMNKKSQYCLKYARKSKKWSFIYKLLKYCQCGCFFF